MKIRIPVIFIALLLVSASSAVRAGKEQTGTEAMQYFSANYLEARQKFLDASHAAGADLEHFQNPHTGPQGEPLFTDVALLGPRDANTILVLSSATHGVEGFTGSAIQTGLLQEGIGSHLAADTGLLLIHAINPCGFAHLRRVNEDNVDLNRNFGDHTKPYPANPGYEVLADAISPASLSIWANARSTMKLFWYGLTNGRDALKQAISGGQYIHPQGLFYGGRQEAWSNKTIRAIAGKYLGSAKRVVIIDFHTGLGPYGNAEVIMNEPEQSSAYRRAVTWWGDRVRSSVSGGSVSIHLEATLKLGFSTMLPDAEITAVSLEFGTVEPKQVFLALRAENWLHHHGSPDHPRAKEIKEDLLRAFYPDQDDWRMQVLEHGRTVVEQVQQQLQ
ncbi:MAG: M14 family metallopeptidase [Proteobacteria bacterium]|nr:M14 family metallopeptidase [Pseudomonadota bacterium]